MGFLKAQGKQPQVNASSGGSGRYSLVEPGYYTAVVSGCKVGTYTGKFKGLKGEFNYLKLTPEFTLFNEAQTLINRQDITLGVVNSDGVLYRPDGDDEKPAMFTDGAFFISSLGFVDEAGNVDIEGFAPELVAGQVIRVRVGTENYTDREGETRAKNKITGFYPVRDEDVDNLELYPSRGMIFLSEEAASAWDELYDAVREDAEATEPF